MADDELAVRAGTMGKKMTNDRLQMTNVWLVLAAAERLGDVAWSPICHLSFGICHF
jgi:hypothetical protein